MTVADVIDALAIPAGALVGQRVPKKQLLEQGLPTPADRRRVQDSLEDLHWVAALKPTNIGVAAFRDDTREYLEVAVLSATFRTDAKAARMIELIHRAIPYPLLLVSEHDAEVTVSLAHKRWSQGEAGKVVVEALRHVTLGAVSSAQESAFLASLAIADLPSRNLFTLYEGLVDRVTALEAAAITGVFAEAEADSATAVRRESLGRHAQITRELAILRAAAHKEKQLNRRVDLNLEIKRLEAELIEARKQL
jgi:hypothetical protein